MPQQTMYIRPDNWAYVVELKEKGILAETINRLLKEESSQIYDLKSVKARLITIQKENETRKTEEEFLLRQEKILEQEEAERQEQEEKRKAREEAEEADKKRKQEERAFNTNLKALKNMFVIKDVE